MDNVYYLPNELPSILNYPEVGERKGDIQTIISYGSTVQGAIADYNSGKTNRIDANEDELNSHISLCRDVCNALGTATNVCFDILAQLRIIQKLMQDLIYLKRTYGDQYVGTPTTNASDGGVL